ncbi:MAG TPA: extracellular solute-binding protein [Solirubrobacteraceae bacterium]|nr:extracellular solute-binding protein [Solirubrobacteraceae bacterium]
MADRRVWRIPSIAATLLMLLSGLGIWGCGGAGDPAATITLYSAQHQQTTDALIAAFTKQTGIKVRVDNNDEDILTAQINQEGDLSPADVFYTENSNWLEQLNAQGLLTKVKPSTLANVPKRDSALNGNWVGVSARVSVLVYNTSKLSPSQLPKSVMELADPKWMGKIELAPTETDLWPIVSSVDRAEGHAATLRWLIGMESNAAGNDQVPDNEVLTRDVSQGITDLGLINHYYYYRLRAEIGKSSTKADVAYFAPHDPGYVEDISGVGVLKSSKHKAAAEEFVQFMTSDAGQRALAKSDSFEYPIHPGVAASPELPPLSGLQPSSFTPAELGSGLDAKTLLEEAGLI